MRGVVGVGARHDRTAAPRTSPWRPTTSSSRFATASGAATRRAPASSRSCWRSSTRSKTRCAALGVVVWPMVEFEADDALASGAALAARDPRVEHVVICTPDKDLGAVRPRHARRAVGPPHATRRATRPASSPSSACRRRRFPTTSRSWATPPTAIPGLRGWGAEVDGRGPRASSGISRPFRRTRATWRVNATSAATPGRDARARARAGVPLPGPRDAAHRHPALRVGRRARVARADAGVRAVRAAARQGGRRDALLALQRLLILAALMQDEMRHGASLILDERDLGVDGLEKDTSSPTPERPRASPGRCLRHEAVRLPG